MTWLRAASRSSFVVSFLATGAAVAWTIGALEELLDGGVARRHTVDLTWSSEFNVQVSTSTGTNPTKGAVQASIDGGATWVYLDTGTSSIGAYASMASATTQNTSGWTAIHSSLRRACILRFVAVDGASTVHNTVTASVSIR